MKATAVTFTDYASAEAILRMPDVVGRAVRDGMVPAAAARPWLARLATAPTFFAAVTLVTVVAGPDRSGPLMLI